MSWNDDTFTRDDGSTGWQDDKNAGTKIEASLHDANDNDLAAGINTCLTKTGQNTPTADLPMGGFKHTGVDDGTARAHYASVGQTQDQTFLFGGGTGGSATAMTLSLTPAITAYADGMKIRFYSGVGANTGALTLNVNGVGAKDVKKQNSTGGTLADLEAGDIGVAGLAEVMYLSSADDFILLNPKIPYYETAYLNDLTASQLVATDANKKLESVSEAGLHSDYFTDATWSPTITASGSMTVSNQTIWQARYQLVGSYYLVTFSAQFDLGGTASNLIQVPEFTTGTDDNANMKLPNGRVLDGSGSYLPIAVRYQSTDFICFKPDSSNFDITGTGHELHFQYFMRA